MIFSDAIDLVTAELKKEGFGIITSIDVKETMKQKLGIDYHAYTILGACNPILAHKALEAEQELGLLLPCNVIVYTGRDGKTVISFFDPVIMGKIIDNPDLVPIASEVREKLLKVFQAIN
jgi:uncharacterized protein (DUF302 family)